MDADNLQLAASLVSASYISQGGAALAARRRLVKGLLSNRRLPQEGWDEATIEMLLQDAALMDSNTFPGQVGLGEREGRVACPLVARMHCRLSHGIGRSGDIAAEQPKAAGSSMLAKLAAHLAGDALRIAGLADMALPLLLPSATGMALTLVLLAAAGAPAAARAGLIVDKQPAVKGEGSKEPRAAATAASEASQLAAAAGGCSGAPTVLPRYVVWSRIDQKTCLKAITAANLVPIVVELLQQGDHLVTDVAGMQQAVERLGPANVAAVVTTTSCFAPRASDDVVAVAKLCSKLGVPHIINNAYGVQAASLTAAVTAACRRGRVDAIVQSTDKNFMVPVGGSVVAAPAGKGRDWLVQAVAKGYPGRASMTAHLDLLVTLLHWGAVGWARVLQQREDLYGYLSEQLAQAAAQLGERVLSTPGNPISLGMTLDGLAAAAAAANAAADEAAAAAAAGAGSSSEAAAGAAAGGGGSSKKHVDVTFFGAMLWARNVSGTRVLTCGKQQDVAGITFADYGCHISGYPHPYMTAAAALGTTKADVDVFVVRLLRAYKELQEKWRRAAGQQTT
uniref:O-phosphoseryl-tRNA(Sec) selenium transferase n=1 Tax=Tetradesmus obliquus TaxID=3088 RepID=A0A383VZ09_TETOB|eukprot:jgi/Sobl393_1/12711/SZX70687.1